MQINSRGDYINEYYDKDDEVTVYRAHPQEVREPNYKEYGMHTAHINYMPHWFGSGFNASSNKESIQHYTEHVSTLINEYRVRLDGLKYAVVEIGVEWLVLLCSKLYCPDRIEEFKGLHDRCKKWIEQFDVIVYEAPRVWEGGFEQALCRQSANPYSIIAECQEKVYKYNYLFRTEKACEMVKKGFIRATESKKWVKENREPHWNKIGSVDWNAISYYEAAWESFYRDVINGIIPVRF